MNISSNDTIKYIAGLTDREIENMREAYSAAALKKMVKIIITDYNTEAPTWIYIGHRHDHIIVPRIYCTCRDFNIRVMTRKQHLSCKHLVIQYIAEKMGRYRILKIKLNDYKKIIKEILEIGISPTIRKLLYVSMKR